MLIGITRPIINIKFNVDEIAAEDESHILSRIQNLHNEYFEKCGELNFDSIDYFFHFIPSIDDSFSGRHQNIFDESCYGMTTYMEYVFWPLPSMMMFQPNAGTFRQICIELNFKNEKIRLRLCQAPLDWNPIEMKFKMIFPQLKMETELKWSQCHRTLSVYRSQKLY